MTKALSLFELNSLVADVIDATLSRSYWVEAELSEARENRGHCYMELIEKNEGSNVPIARASAKCWSNIWTLIKPAFVRITGQEIRAGMKVMLQVHAQFHPQYGFSWIVDDINPEYTMGDMMRKRQEIIRQLKAEGVFDLQKELCLPMFAQRIAVISSETAAGYGDFCNQLETNDYILDMVSFQRMKTPTAAAAYLIDHLASTLMRVENAQAAIIDGVKKALEVEKMRIQHIGSHIPVLFSVVRTKQDAWLEGLSQRLVMRMNEAIKQADFHLRTLQNRMLLTLQNKLSVEQHRLDILEQRARLLDPSLLLKRGYSITLCNGRTIRNAKDLKIGDTITTRFETGEVESKVERLS